MTKDREDPYAEELDGYTGHVLAGWGRGSKHVVWVSSIATSAAYPPDGITDRSRWTSVEKMLTRSEADAELAALEQECRDRECTEQDVRARLADAENALAKVKALTDVAAKQPSSQQWVHVVAIRTAADGTS